MEQQSNVQASNRADRRQQQREERRRNNDPSKKVLKRVDYRYEGAQALWSSASPKSIMIQLGYGTDRHQEMVRVFEREIVLRKATADELGRELSVGMSFERESLRLANMRRFAEVRKAVLPNGMVADGVAVFALYPNGLEDVSIDPYMLQIAARGYKLANAFMRTEKVGNRDHLFIVFERIDESPYSAEVQDAVNSYLRNNTFSHLVLWDNRDTAGTIVLAAPGPRGNRVEPKHYLQLLPFEILVGTDGRRSYAPGVKPNHVFKHVVLTPEDYFAEQGIEPPVAEKKAPPVKDVEGLKAKGVDPIVSSRWEGNEAPLLPRPSIY